MQLHYENLAKLASDNNFYILATGQLRMFLAQDLLTDAICIAQYAHDDTGYYLPEHLDIDYYPSIDEALPKLI